jgi:Rps23 Pro-64 3,4-dihydroxylase Tpa1-like proline 4-hydroxylase
VSADFQLAPHHDAASYAAAFAAGGRVHVSNLLREEDARRLHAAMARVPWHLLIVHQGHRQLPLKQWEAIPPDHKQALETSFAEGARTPGQFSARYLTAHLSNNGGPYEGDDPDLQALVRFLNSAAFLSFARTVTGDDAIKLTDVHASQYRPGDFLHTHNDTIEEEFGVRSAAYILNLTPVWQAEWGGLLNFVREDGHVDGAFTPSWNAMNFLKVPQLHFVSSVAGFVTEPRLSVSGWVRHR